MTAIPLSSDLDSRTKFTIGTGFEPESLNLDAETDRLRAKIYTGVDYVMTKPVFDDVSMETIVPYRDFTYFSSRIKTYDGSVSLRKAGTEHSHN